MADSAIDLQQSDVCDPVPTGLAEAAEQYLATTERTGAILGASAAVAFSKAHEQAYARGMQHQGVQDAKQIVARSAQMGEAVAIVQRDALVRGAQNTTMLTLLLATPATLAAAVFSAWFMLGLILPVAGLSSFLLVLNSGSKPRKSQL